MRKTIRLLIVFVTLLTTLPLLAGGAKKGWIKLELTRLDGGAVPDALLSASGAELVTRFDNRAIVQVPKGRVASIIQASANAGVSVRERDELDLLQLPGAVVDVREGLVDAPQHELIRAYRPGKPGLFLLQFTAAPHRQWIADVEALGWKLVRYVPHNAFIAVGTPELVTRTRALQFLQWVDFYHPYQKYSVLARNGSENRVMFELPTGAASEETIEAIRAVSSGAIRIHRGSVDTIVHATMASAQAEKLLHQQLIIGVGPEPVMGLSDERQVMSLTSNVNATQTAPTSPGSYWNWVLSRCPNCSNMPAADWKVGVADTGLDNGEQYGGHPDLDGRKYFGANFGTSTECADRGLPPLCGWNVHGTFVSGVIAANGPTAIGGTGYIDADGYHLGQGVAPTVGIFMTRISSDDSVAPDYLLKYTKDAASNNVTVQNHSFNDYGAAAETTGTYSALARQYDLVVRDANDDPSDGQKPLFISVSSGNSLDGNDDNVDRYLAIAGGTAKNVLSVAATESSPEQSDTCQTVGDNYQDLAWFSRTGTVNPNYIKPDVVAPGTAIVSTHPTIKPPPSPPYIGYCDAYIAGHSEYIKALGGTSFAAPVGAGAAILVKRYLGATPAATSPALTKAMIIGGARSIRGGEDRTQTPVATIGPAPNTRQGFGRISLDDVLTGTTPPVVFDQAPARLFTDSGQSQIARLKVRDASKPVKVVLVWSDAAGNTGNIDPLVNDLDLEVTPATGNVVYVGNRLAVSNAIQGETSTPYTIGQTLSPDVTNNVEYARFFGTANAEFGVTVRASRITGNINGIAGNEQDFALVAVNADLVTDFQAPLAAPGNVAATAAGGTVTITWVKVTNATGYKIERKLGSAWTVAKSVSGGTVETTTDTPGTADGVVLYRVRATIGSTESAPSNVDIAYAKAFTDEPLLSGPTTYTKIKAEHVVELRKAVNTLRAINGDQAIYTGTALDPNTLRNQPIDATELSTLLGHLNDARGEADVTPAVEFSGADPATNVKILPSHIHDLRNGLK
jgi:hypothetical protein